ERHPHDGAIGVAVTLLDREMIDFAGDEPRVVRLLHGVFLLEADALEYARLHLLAGEAAKPQVRVVDQAEGVPAGRDAPPGNPDRSGLEDEPELRLLALELLLRDLQRR